MDWEKEKVCRVYHSMAKIGKEEYSGIPAIDPQADAPEYTAYYEALREILDRISSGFPRAAALAGMPAGADIRMLQVLFLPEHAKLAIHVPTDRFATASEIAAHAAVSEVHALGMLLDMAARGCIFHKKDGGEDFFRHVGQIPGVIEFQPRRLSMEYRDATADYVAGYLRPVMFDLEVPSWRWIPINEQAVADNRILTFDNAEKLLLEADRVSVCSCMCRAVQKTPCRHGEPPYELCLQLNEFADFYVNDIKISRYIDHDAIKKILKFNYENDIAMEVSGSQRAEMICSCCECCCEPIRIFRKFGGQAVKKITNYVLDWDESACTGCGLCVEHCFTQEGIVLAEDGRLVFHQEKCVGCGVCARNCPARALILRLKKPEEIFEPPVSMYDLYEVQGKGRRRTDRKD